MEKEIGTQDIKEREIIRNQEFRGLVGELVKKSGLFETWVNPLDPEEKIGILDAVEKNKLSLFMGEHLSGRRLNAVSCLTMIYDELGQEKPNRDFVENAVGQLKEFL